MSAVDMNAIDASPLTLDLGRTGREAYVQVGGELDLLTAPQLLTLVDEVLADGDDRIVVDLGGVTFVDLCGLSALAEAGRRCRSTSAALAVTNAPRLARRVLTLTGLGSSLDVR